MKLFLSWSGARSRDLAKSFHGWIPLVLQSVAPWFSQEDIEKGSRWISDLSSQLDQQSFAILFVTPDNMMAPWLTFEAGALSKSIDASRVCPVLLGVDPVDFQGPLAQFQITSTTKEDIRRLVTTINKHLASPISEKHLETVFETFWPRLEQEIGAIRNVGRTETTRPRPPPEVLGEILDRVRAMERHLVNATPKGTLKEPARVAGEANSTKGLTPNAELAQHVSELSAIASSTTGPRNMFRDLIAGWRIRRATDEVLAIRRGDWHFQARASENYVTYFLCQIMAILGESDEYCSVTTLSFWSSSAIRETDFLRANIEAAERGARIRRIFLIPKQDLEEKSRLTEAREIITSYDRFLAGASRNAQERLISHFKICDDFSTDVAHYTHFALAQKAPLLRALGESVYIQPYYLADSSGHLRISSLATSFPTKGSVQSNEAKTVLRRFNNLMERTEDIGVLLSRLNAVVEDVQISVVAPKK
jgi:TIR domain